MIKAPTRTILTALLSLHALAALAQIDDTNFRVDLRSIAAEPRIVGSIGYYRAVDYVESQIRPLQNVELRRHEFPVLVPVTRHAALYRQGVKSEAEPIYPFWPAQVRHNATPPEGITGRPVYIGQARFEEIHPASLAGQIAVIESHAAGGWTNAAYFGAKAILVLGADPDNNVDLRTHDLLVPVNLPRFFVTPGPLADDLRAGRITEPVTIKASVDWERRTAVNLYALVSPANPPDWDLRTPPAALMVSVPIDSSGLVPDLAIGASQAANTAAGLALLRDASRNPPERPLLVFFSGADSIQMLGTRNMFMALSDVPARWEREIVQLDARADALREDAGRLAAIFPDPTRIDVAKDRRQVDRIVKIVETDISLEQDELFRLRRGRDEEKTNQDREREKQLEQNQILLNQLRFCFLQRPRDLGGDLQPAAQRYVQKALEQIGDDDASGLLEHIDQRAAELRQRVELNDWLRQQLGKPRVTDERSNQNRLIELLAALDLSDRGVRCGPMYWGRFQQFSSISQIQDYRDWFTRQERAFLDNQPGSQWWGDIRSVIDFEPLTGVRSPQSWICASIPIGSELAQAWGVPGFSIITLDDLRLVRDTPSDTLDNLDAEAIIPQLVGVRELLRRAWSDPRFRSQSDLKWLRTDLVGQVVSAAPGRPVPDLPRDGFVATYYYVANFTSRIPQPRFLPWTMGVRRNEVRHTDPEGNYLFEGLPRLGDPLQMLAIKVFQIEPETGTITASTDLGRQGADIRFYADLRFDLQPFRSVVFACEEFALVGLYDPRFLQALGEMIPLDARRNAEPQRFNALLFNQLFAGFVEPGAISQFLFRYGRVGNRLVLINMPDDPALASGSGRGEGLGFSVPNLRNIEPLALVTARDFWRLDDARLEQYRRAGVSNSLVDDLHVLARRQLDDARAAYDTDHAATMMMHATGAWANNARVYSATQEMANDVVRGAIFLLLLCVPFAFCMERLLVGTPNIYKQIAGGIAIFSIMTLALWSFHPAFKISSSPLIIILAFAIIFMSIVVIGVVYGKFDSELKRIRSGRGTAETTSFARASVLTSAVLLGIANMRKRRFRTALTAITIVLITFAVLAFASATRYLDTTTLPAGVATSHPGVMLRQRGFRPMPEEILANLRPLLPGHTLVQRWWNVNAWEPRDQIHFTAGPDSPAQRPRVFAPQAVLGLSPGESQLSRIAEVIGHEKFDRLERGEQHIVYLSRPIASFLDVREGDTVRAGGIELEVAAIFDPDAFDQKVLTLSGEPLAPLKYTPGALDAGGRALFDTALESLDLDVHAAGAELGAAYEHLPSSQFVIVPARTARLLPNATLRSVEVRLADGLAVQETDAVVKEKSDELAKRFALAMYAGFSDGVRMVAASNLASVSGAGSVAIPLVIAGLIIFNTMMGSIAERQREIHVYTSLGLAPMHVGALFLAEAMTYGLIGTVFGYIIGQGVGTAMMNLGWLGNVTLNYSGTSAMMTMGLILLIVLLSALVPARLASKLAAPSIERTWKVPLPHGDEILAVLPFTINKTAADGALAYLVEYFDAHQEGSIGKFSADRIETFLTTDDSNRVSRGLRTTVWLTPFDLGVRQQLTLLIRPGQHDDIYEVHVILNRLSGDDGSWYRMNRTFLTELRKQFLQWRSLSPQRMLEYVEESRKLFAGTEEEMADEVTT